ncbi:MAG: CBO0543 family protein [Bacillota bacterium]|nr:CBO0543 family protein [Bacillota bacterium]
MNHTKRYKLILYVLTLFGIILLPVGLKRKPRKDWIIVFLLKTLISSFVGNVIAATKTLEFPVRLFPKAFKSSVLYDILLFPLLCLFYNQTTYKSKLIGIISQEFMYSLPMTWIEIILEKKTNLIKYNSWKWYYTLFSLTGTFLLVRGVIGYIRKITLTEPAETN